MDIYQRLKEVREKLAFYELEDELLTLELKSAIGDARGIKGVATWGMQRVPPFFDVKRLQKERRDIYEQYAIDKQGRYLSLK